MDIAALRAYAAVAQAAGRIEGRNPAEDAAQAAGASPSCKYLLCKQLYPS